MRRAIIVAIIIAVIVAAIIAFLIWYFFPIYKPMGLLAVNDCDSTDLDLVADGRGNYYAAYDCPKENRVEIIKIVNDAANYDNPRPIFEGIKESHVSISVAADGTVYAFAVVENDLRSVTCTSGDIQKCANPANVSGSSLDGANDTVTQTLFVASDNNDLLQNAVYNTGSASIVPVHVIDGCIGHHDSAVGPADTVYEVWENDCEQEIMFSASYDKGATWTQTVNLSNSPGDSQEPRVAASGDTVHITWVDNSTGANEIFYSKSTDTGNTFNGGTANSAGDPINLSNTPGSSTDHEICVSGNDFYAVWRDLETGSGDIYLSKNNAPAQNLDADPTAAYEPDIACKDSTVIVGFTRERGPTSGQGDAFFIKSADGGATFSDPKNVSNNENGDSKTALVSITHDNEIYEAWLDTDGDRQHIADGTYSVFASKSTDGGETFSEPKNYSDDPANLKKDDDVTSTVFELEDKLCAWDMHCARCQSAASNY